MKNRSERLRVERLRGMYDLLPETYQRQRQVTEQLGAVLALAGYAHIDTPVLEQSDLFQASFGQESWQNLYSFRLHHRDLCMRPEYTASICRLYLDHYQQQALPLRFQYAGPVFRYEASGRTRYRQHTQLGIELFGGQTAAADAEIVQLACDLLHSLKIKQYRLELGHIEVVSGFIKRLHLDEQAARLLLSLMEQISRSEEGERAAQARLESLYPEGEGSHATNGAAAADSRYISTLLSGISISFGDDDARSEIVERFLWKTGRSEQRRQILYGLEFLRALHKVAGPPSQVFDALRDLLARYKIDAEPLRELELLVTLLQENGVPEEQILVNLALGRGVSYYTGLLFEIHSQRGDGLDTQLCGGGRYDRLMRAVGSPREVSACGFAFGVERLLSLLPESKPFETTQAIVIPVHGAQLGYAQRVARTLRGQGVRTEVDITGHGLSAGLRLAAKKQARLALIVGEDEQREGSVNVRDLVRGEEQRVRLEELAGQVEKEKRL